MELINNLIKFFSKPESETKDAAPEGLCPMCWGYQGYDKKIRNIFKDRQIDVNNHQDRYSLIEDFVKHNIDGIRLLEGKTSDSQACACNLGNKKQE